jgi:hypothetical protein
MDEHELLSRITAAKAEFGVKCKKYAGAVTAELLKEALQRHGIPTSARDVFIEAIPVEIDLLILKPGTVPRHGILYRAEDVLAVLEVKNSGAFGKDAIEQAAKTFGLICALSPHTYCAYVTLTERRGYKHAVTEDNLKYPAYTLFWYTGSSAENSSCDASGDFARLLKSLQAIIAAHR